MDTPKRSDFIRADMMVFDRLPRKIRAVIRDMPTPPLATMVQKSLNQFGMKVTLETLKEIAEEQAQQKVA